MSRIKITILGTTAGVPTTERGHAAIYLSYYDREETCLLFDCGEGTQRQFRFAHLNMPKIDNVFITHWHGDHCLGLPGMVDTMGFEGRKRPLTVYAPQARRVRKSLGFSCSMGKFKVKTRNVPAKGRRAVCLMETDRFRVVSIPVKHSIPAVAYALVEKDKISIDLKKAASLGLPEKGEIYRELKAGKAITFGGRRIRLEDISVKKEGKKIVYSGDTEICDNLRTLARGADLLIQDCTYFNGPGEEKPYKHASLPEVIEMIRAEKIKRTILTHVSRKYPDAAKLRELLKEHPGLELAEDMATVVV